MQMMKFEHTFDGKPVTTIRYKDRECWLARQVGEALGYSDGGKGFVSTVMRNWSEEMIDGADYAIVQGDDARNLSDLFRGDGLSPLATTPFDNPRGALVLYESGLYLALMKTDKPAGKDMRRWLATEVLPSIRETGAYVDPGVPAEDVPAVVEAAARRTIARRLQREATRYQRCGAVQAAEHLRLTALEALADRVMPEVRAALDAALAAGVKFDVPTTREPTPNDAAQMSLLDHAQRTPSPVLAPGLEPEPPDGPVEPLPRRMRLEAPVYDWLKECTVRTEVPHLRIDDALDSFHIWTMGRSDCRGVRADRYSMGRALSRNGVEGATTDDGRRYMLRLVEDEGNKALDKVGDECPAGVHPMFWVWFKACVSTEHGNVRTSPKEAYTACNKWLRQRRAGFTFTNREISTQFWRLGLKGVDKRGMPYFSVWIPS